MNLLIVIIVLLVLPLFFLFVFVYLPTTLRSYRLRKLADKFGLAFYNNTKMFSFWGELTYKRNIITGCINNHSVEIYDFYKMINLGDDGFFQRSSILIKDGKEIKLGGFLWFASVGKVEKALNDMKIQDH